MPTPEDNAKTVNAYLGALARGSVDEIVALYADDATVEDPVGGEVHIGREAIRGFYSGVDNVSAVTDVVTLRALGHEVAWYWNLTLTGMTISIISVMTLGDDGKITSMKAYWSPENIVTD